MNKLKPDNNIKKVETLVTKIFKLMASHMATARPLCKSVDPNTGLSINSVSIIRRQPKQGKTRLQVPGKQGIVTAKLRQDPKNTVGIWPIVCVTAGPSSQQRAKSCSQPHPLPLPPSILIRAGRSRGKKIEPSDEVM